MLFEINILQRLVKKTPLQKKAAVPLQSTAIKTGNKLFT
jgi:hypothetical protein